MFELYYFPVGDPDNLGYFIPAALPIMILEENDKHTNRCSYVFYHRTGYLHSCAPKEIKSFIEDVNQPSTKQKAPAHPRFFTASFQIFMGIFSFDIFPGLTLHNACLFPENHDEDITRIEQEKQENLNALWEYLDLFGTREVLSAGPRFSISYGE